MGNRADLAAAAAAWNDPTETLESVNQRIHDAFPLDRLADRADGYINALFENFPYIRIPPHCSCLEIGSGVGYIMEAVRRKLDRLGCPAGSIIGLDIAEHMLAKAEQRLGPSPPYRFVYYDGLTVPLPDQCLDFIYSVAALQHIPKPYVYNLFFEIRRLLKPTGFAVLHLLSFNQMSAQEDGLPWKEEIRNQVECRAGHWHHFYSQAELEAVLRVGTHFRHVEVRESGSWVCVATSDLTGSRTSASE